MDDGDQSEQFSEGTKKRIIPCTTYARSEQW